MTQAIAPAMRAEIERRLAAVEREEQVRVVYACESGSRAWGFPSADSDYDVRFIYLRPADWYLSIDFEHRRDVIERPISDALDVSGWDLRKALQLFRKSNPPLLEWLDSPIIYRDALGVAARMRALKPTFFSPRACGYHYLHMVGNTLRQYFKNEQVRTKKYFYALRPLLAVLWLERGLGPAPIEFSKLVAAVIDEPALRQRIERLMQDKRAGFETDVGPRIPAIQAFIDREFARLQETPFGESQPPPDPAPLNALFRDTLQAAADA